ncbi:MAG: flagellar biosynthesis anti-sigma factor FlgM [Lachnospiraceae bacterium]|nr:flagellar biosynthesis anti-sigma factor FlgM [Lachnospiraceae bacterium]
MRIGTYNMINQLYSNTSSKKTAAANGTNYASFKDEVSFSSMGKDMQVAKNALKSVSDIREDLVSDIKSRIDNGTYDVSNDDFTTKLIEAFSNK